MKKLLLCLLLFSQYAFAQKELTEGYIVTADGTKIQGYVLDRGDGWRGNEIKFARAKNEDLTTYSFIDLKSVYIEKYKSHYFSKIVSLDLKPVEISKLDNTPARKIVSDTVLLTLLVGGKLNLYRYSDQGGKLHFFIEKEGSEVEELAFVRYLKDDHLVEMPYFQSSLKTLAGECDNIKKGVTTLNEKQLSKFVRAYNSCFGTEGYSTGKRSKLIFYPVAGISSHSPYYASSVPDGLTNNPAVGDDYTTTTGQLIGAGLEFRPVRQTTHSRAGLILTWQTTQPSHRSVLVVDRFQYDCALDFTFINIAPYYKYMITSRWIVNPYLRASFNFVVMTNATLTTLRTDILNNTSTTTTEEPFGSIAAGGTLSAGVSAGRFNAEFGYQSFTTGAGGDARTGLPGFLGMIAFDLNKIK